MDRRQYQRVQAPVRCRPAGAIPPAGEHPAVDLSLTGVRLYCDDEYDVGSTVEMEFLTEASGPVTYTGKVVWVYPLGPEAAAKFDVGMEFVKLAPKTLQLLSTLLVPDPDDGIAP